MVTFDSNFVAPDTAPDVFETQQSGSKATRPGTMLTMLQQAANDVFVSLGKNRSCVLLQPWSFSL